MAAGKSIGYGRIFLILSIGVFLFFLLSNVTDVYRFAFVGAIYELLWLPAMLLLFGLPVFVIVFWGREKFSLRSIHLYSMLVWAATILLLMLLN